MTAELAIDGVGDIWILVPNSIIFNHNLGPGASWVRHGEAPIAEMYPTSESLADAVGGIDLYQRVAIE